MDLRIEHLSCRYRVASGSGPAGSAVTRLERLARERLGEASAEALGEALGDDPSVYVLRRIVTHHAICVRGDTPDEHLTRPWAEEVAGAVARAIAYGDAGSGNLVRFESHADYVACFLSDLLKGDAWSRWFYGAFAPLRSESKANSLRMVLLDNRDSLPDILVDLRHYGTLEAALNDLDANTLTLLWSHVKGASTILDEEVVRPVFARALDLAQHLDLWRARNPQEDLLFKSYLDTSPRPPDWRDARGLAVSIYEVFRFLAGRGYLRMGREANERVGPRLDSALAGFDWLDVRWLRASLWALLVEPQTLARGMPVRSAGGPTPKQLELLSDLATILRERPVLDPGEPDSPANGLRLYAALVSRFTRWRDEPAVPGTIERLLTLWQWSAGSPTHKDIVRKVLHGDANAGSGVGDLPARASQALTSLSGTGASGVAVVELLAGTQHQSAGKSLRRVQTGCAGLFLLLRAALDVRLDWLARRTNYPPHEHGVTTSVSAFLLALGTCLAGRPSLTDNLYDAGLRIWAGLIAGEAEGADSGDRFDVEIQRRAWPAATPADHARFQAAMLRLLVDQHLERGSALHLYRLEHEDQDTLVAGGETPGLWPLGRVVNGGEQAAGTVAEWFDLWEEVIGSPPSLVVVDESLAEVPPVTAFLAERRNRGAPAILVSSGGSIPGALGERPVEGAHHANREALPAALSHLAHALLGSPDADLTITLAASALLRLWARWLPRFAHASAPYLLDNFIRRPGVISMEGESLVIAMDRKPLDILMEMAGYLDELERVPWIGDRHVRFELRGP